jgi:winged helix DNA-binding protein
VKTEERYEPTFSYRWDLVEAWLPDAVAAGRRLSRQRAVELVVERYVTGAVFASTKSLRRVLGLPHAELTAAVTRLARRRVLVDDCAVTGWPGRWLVSSAALR